jgi:hypothetical protein
MSSIVSMGGGNIFSSNISGISFSGGTISSSICRTTKNGRTVSSTIGSMIHGANPRTPGLLTFEEMLSQFGEQTTVGYFSYGQGNAAVEMRELQINNGKIMSGEVIKGSVKNSDGVVYTAGTLFRNGKAYVPESSVKPTGTELSSAPAAPLETRLIITIPMKKINRGMYLNVTGDAQLDVESCMASFLNLTTADSGKFNWTNASLSKFSLESQDRSNISISYKEPMDVDKLAVRANDYSTISLSMKESLGGGRNRSEPLQSYVIILNTTDHASIKISDLDAPFTSDIPVTFTLDGYSKIQLDRCNFLNYALNAKDHGAFILTQGNKFHKGEAPIFTTIKLDDYTNADIQAWSNKYKITCKEHATVKVETGKEVESLMINASDYVNARFNGTVKKAQLRSDEHAKIWAYMVTEVLDDKNKDYSSINVEHKPDQNRFQF